MCCVLWFSDSIDKPSIDGWVNVRRLFDFFLMLYSSLFDLFYEIQLNWFLNRYGIIRIRRFCSFFLSLFFCSRSFCFNVTSVAANSWRVNGKKVKQNIRFDVWLRWSQTKRINLLKWIYRYCTDVANGTEKNEPFKDWINPNGIHEIRLFPSWCVPMSTVHTTKSEGERGVECFRSMKKKKQRERIFYHV